MNDLTVTTSATEIQASNNFNGATIGRFIAFIGKRNPTTVKTYVNNLKRFFVWLHDNDIHQPTRENVIQYVQDLTNSGKQPTTVNQYLITLKQFFKWAASEGLYLNVADNIQGERIAAHTHKKDNLKAQQVVTIEKSILAHSADKQSELLAAKKVKDQNGKLERNREKAKRLYAMFLLAVNAGLRTVELSRAKVKDLSFKDGNYILYIYGKGHTSADTPKALAPEVGEAIKDYLNYRSDKYTQDSFLFVSTGNRSHGKQIATTTISTMLKQAMVEAGYNDARLTAHSLRHTTAQAMLELTDKNIYKTQEYLRHANPATTEIYLRESPTFLQEQAELAKDLYKHYHE